MTGAVVVTVPASAGTPVDLGYFAAGTYHLAGAGVASLVSSASDPNSLLFNPDGTPEVPVTRSGFGYLNPAGAALNVPDGNIYGPGGAAAKLGALLGTLSANPASAAAYFTIGRGTDVVLNAAGHIYAQVNDTYYPDNQYGFVVTVTPATSAAAATTQTFDAAGLPYALSAYNTGTASVVAGGPTGSFLRLTTAGTTYQNNVADFSATTAALADSVQVDFDFRISPGTTRGTSLSAVLLATSAFGTGGPSTSFNTVASVAKGLGVSLIVANDSSDKHVVLTWDGTTITTATAPFDIGAAAWDHARIVVTRTDGGALVSVILTPNGGTAVAVIDQAFVGGYALTPARLAIAGQSDSRTGSQDVDNVAVTTTPAASPLPAITLGSTVNGTIGHTGGVNYYTLTLAAATSLVFDGLTNGNFAWSLTGLGQNIGRNFNGSDSADFGSDPVLKLGAGTYQLAISSIPGYGTTGAYAFRLLNLASATALTAGTPVTGSLDPGNGTALYQFTAAAGDQYDITGLTGWNGTQYYRLIDPSGQQVLAPTPAYNTSGVFTTTLAGTYTLLVEGRYYATVAGPYGFTLTKPVSQSLALTLGTQVSGNITPGGSVTYTVTLASAAQLFLHNSLNTTDLSYTVTGPGGVVLASTYVYYDMLPVLAGPGTYTVTVRATTDGGTGAFKFTLLDLLTNTTPLALGTSVSGSIAAPNGVVAYAITVPAGGRVAFTAATAPSGLNWELVDPYGKAVFGPTSVANTALLTLAGGRYVLLLTGTASQTTNALAYTVVAQPADDSTAALTLGAVTSGSIPTSGATRSYSFTLATPTQLLLAPLTDTLGSGAIYDSSLQWVLTGPGGLSITRAFNYSDSSVFGIGNPSIALGAGAYTPDSVGLSRCHRKLLIPPAGPCGGHAGYAG